MTNVKESWDNLMEELHEISEYGSENPKLLSEIPVLFGKIPELVLYDDDPASGGSLVHYTTWKRALTMFDKKHKLPAFRMYNYEYSNDPDEGCIKPTEWRKIEESLEWAKKFLKSDSHWIEEMKFDGSTYGCSFSSDPGDIDDDLTYWRLYGNDGQGCSLKATTFPNKMRAYKVRYRDKDSSGEPEDIEVACRLRALCRLCKKIVDETSREYGDDVGKIDDVGKVVAVGLFRIIYGYYHLIKHKAYEGEREWRIIRVMPRPEEIEYDRTPEDLVRRYINGPAFGELLSSNSTITIGPTVPNRGAARAYLESLVRKHRIENVRVKNSSKTYRQT